MQETGKIRGIRITISYEFLPPVEKFSLGEFVKFLDEQIRSVTSLVPLLALFWRNWN